MLGRSFCYAALVLAALATATLGAQTAAPAKTQPAATNHGTGDRYVPAIMQERTMTVTGCLQKNQGWVLTGATLAGQKDTATYKLEGIGDARLSLFDGKRIEVTGAMPFASGSAGGAAKTASAPPASAAASKSLPIFEATAVKAATGACS
jgi:hypothetical protein